MSLKLHSVHDCSEKKLPNPISYTNTSLQARRASQNYFSEAAQKKSLKNSNRNSTRNSIQAAFSNNPWEPSGRHTRLLATTLPWPKILSFWVIYIITNPRNYFAGRGATLHALFGNWYDQIYFSFFSNCEEIKLSSATSWKIMHFKKYHCCQEHKSHNTTY